MLKLSVAFKNSLGEAHRWTYSEPNKALTSMEVREQMERFAELELFEKDGAKLFASVTSAKFVETIETPLF